jgi:hypothetical protein
MTTKGRPDLEGRSVFERPLDARIIVDRVRITERRELRLGVWGTGEKWPVPVRTGSAGDYAST